MKYNYVLQNGFKMAIMFQRKLWPSILRWKLFIYLNLLSKKSHGKWLPVVSDLGYEYPILGIDGTDTFITTK